MICAYTSIHTYYSVLKKKKEILPFILQKKKKKKNQDETGGGYIKEHKPGKDRKKYCIILSVESLKSLLLL